MSELNELKQMVARIETAVCGDEKAGIEGLVKKVDRHERIIIYAQRIFWTASGAGTIIVLIYNILT